MIVSWAMTTVVTKEPQGQTATAPDTAAGASEDSDRDKSKVPTEPPAWSGAQVE